MQIFNRKQKRAMKKQLQRDSKNYQSELKLLDSGEIPEGEASGLIEVWRSNRYLVQVFEHNHSVLRMSVLRIDVDPGESRYQNGIPWNELQKLKREVGHGESEAVEIYPYDSHQVNVANMRHLWIFKRGMKLPFGFGRGEEKNGME